MDPLGSDDRCHEFDMLSSVVHAHQHEGTWFPSWESSGWVEGPRTAWRVGICGVPGLAEASGEPRRAIYSHGHGPSVTRSAGVATADTAHWVARMGPRRSGTPPVRDMPKSSRTQMRHMQSPITDEGALSPDEPSEARQGQSDLRDADDDREAE